MAGPPRAEPGGYAAVAGGVRSRVMWFVALWGAGVLALTALALPIRWLLKAV